MADIYSRAAADLADVATEAAERVSRRASVRLAMINAAATKLYDSGLFPGGVDYPTVMQSIDCLFDEAALQARKKFVHNKSLNTETITGSVVTFDESYGVALSLRMADNVIDNLRAKQNARQVQREAASPSIAPVVTGDILAEIDKREAANKALGHYPASSKKKGR